MSTAHESPIPGYEEMDDRIAHALSLYSAQRIARRSGQAARTAEAARLELPEGPPGPIEIEAAVGYLISLFEDAGEPLAAMAVLYVAALRTRNPGRMRAAVLALGDCGPEPLGYEAAARMAAVDTVFAGPSLTAHWGDVAPKYTGGVTLGMGRSFAVPGRFAVGDVVRDRRGTSGPLEVRKVHPDGAAFVVRPGSDDFAGRWARPEDLARVERPTIEPTAAEGGAL